MRLRLLLATLLAGTLITPVLAQEPDRRMERRERDNMSRGPIQDRGMMRAPRERIEGEQAQPRFRPPVQPQPQVAQQRQIQQPAQVREGPRQRPDWAQRRGRPADVAIPQPSDPNNRNARGNWQRRASEGTTGSVSPPVIGQTAGDGNRNWRGRDRDNDGVRNNRDWDRNNNGRIDGRWDRDRNGTVDNRWDRNRDGVRDNRDGRNWNNDNNQRWGTRNWTSNQRWNRDWRNDRRYDWQRYRYANRDLFRQPRYYSPFGYNNNYQRFGVGVYLESILFGSRYRISDPWRYRLPDSQWPYEWVRYHDDVLLVDTRNGYVVDVIYDFFW